jgi:hypothetical protein
MEEPLIDYKIDPESPVRIANMVVRFTPSEKAVGAEYQHAVERALAFRRPVAVLVDEAQHLAKMGSGRRLADQLDVVKSLANRTKTVHVLFGTKFERTVEPPEYRYPFPALSAGESGRREVISNRAPLI